MHIAGGHGMVWGLVRDPLPVFEEQARGMLRPIGPGLSKYNRYDALVADRAVDWVERRAQEQDAQPFALFIGFVAPHFPLTVPPEWLSLYPLDAIPPPRLSPRDGYRRRPWVEDMRRSQPVDDSLSDDERRLALACYLGLVSYLDHQVGRVIGALERTGLSTRTRLVYTSDHGDNMGARGLWGKCMMYDESVRIPLIIAGPDVPAGHVCGTPTNLTDGRASILDALGVADDERDDAGRSSFDLARSNDDPDRVTLSEYHAVGTRAGAYMLRDGRYKYIEYVGHRPELFDLDADPGEERDLAGDPAHATTLARYAARQRMLLDPDAVDARARRDLQEMIAPHGGRDKALTLGSPEAPPPPI